jgi:glycosyltransferase involved in cell wall biosynthesis
VVATETAGTTELVVDGESGRVLPQGSTPIEIAEAIKTTIRQIEVMSVAAQKAGEGFSIETCAQGYARLFADMLKR